MEKTGFVEIKISGSKGNIDLSPDNYDIREIITILENAENLLFTGEKKERPIISYKIEEGSVRHILKTSIQHIIGFNAILGQINQAQTIDFLDIATAKAFENIQDLAVKRDYVFGIKTSLDLSNEVRIDKSSHFYRNEAIWADAEFYFYGKITNAGGKDKANIHIYTDEFKTLKIQTPISFLERYSDNLLYKTFGIRVSGKQHSVTGEIDTSTLNFVELIDYQPLYDEVYLKSLRDKAKNSWLIKVDADQWLKGIRDGYE